MQILLDNGHAEVVEMEGGMESWTKAGYPVVTSVTFSLEGFTRVLSPFTLIPGDAEGTPLPVGSFIYHRDNVVTEVIGPDKKRVLIALDSDAARNTTSTGDVKPVTWLYRLPLGAVAAPGANGTNTTNFYLDGKLILTVVRKSDAYVP